MERVTFEESPQAVLREHFTQKGKLMQTCPASLKGSKKGSVDEAERAGRGGGEVNEVKVMGQMGSRSGMAL